MEANFVISPAMLSDSRASARDTWINFLNNSSPKHIFPRNTQVIEAGGAVRVIHVHVCPHLCICSFTCPPRPGHCQQGRWVWDDGTMWWVSAVPGMLRGSHTLYYLGVHPLRSGPSPTSVGVLIHSKDHSQQIINKCQRNCNFNSFKLHKRESNLYDRAALPKNKQTQPWLDSGSLLPHSYLGALLSSPSRALSRLLPEPLPGGPGSFVSSLPPLTYSSLSLLIHLIRQSQKLQSWLSKPEFPLGRRQKGSYACYQQKHHFFSGSGLGREQKGEAGNTPRALISVPVSQATWQTEEDVIISFHSEKSDAQVNGPRPQTQQVTRVKTTICTKTKPTIFFFFTNHKSSVEKWNEIWDGNNKTDENSKTYYSSLFCETDVS